MSDPTALNAACVWQCPEITGVNRLSGRATLWPYADGAAALAEQGLRRLCLDGEWLFTLVDAPQATPADFASSEADPPWATLPVPGLWTMHGYDKPQYCNWRLPFTPVASPRVPDANPTGLYRHHFRVPKDWRGQRLVLHLAGFEAACLSVWVNGQAVGVAKDGRCACEFDISAAARVGNNTIALQLIKWGDSSYIEDQDHWRQYGINRSVYVYATAPAFIEDLFCVGDYNPVDGSGHLAVDLRLGGAGAAGYSMRVWCHGPNGKALRRQPWCAAIPWGLQGHCAEREPIGEVRVRLPRVQAWSHEAPQLYTVVAELVDPEGLVVEATRTRIGFRRVEIVDRELRLNGRMVYIKGVNRHDHHDTTGKVMDRETILSDLRAMRAHHINAIRCSHYPNDPMFYELCDELGFLVIDETNLESHHTYGRTAHDPRYAAAFLDRAMRMVLRDRNHPCIISWSLGNESGFGPNQSAMAGWIRHIDPSRIVHCEGAICRANAEWDQGHHATDLICPMYPEIADLVAWATTNNDPRPLIMCEYSHAMGNSNGSLADYWQAIRAHHGLQGGFIWEWIDHGLRKTTASGEAYWAYGGDFGDHPNDGNFVCDGLVWPNREPHPAMAEVARLFQPLQGRLVDESGLVLISSEYAVLDSSHLRGRYRLLADGVEVAAGALPALDLQPGEQVALAFSEACDGRLAKRQGERTRVLCVCNALPMVAGDVDYHLELSWIDRRDQPLLGRNAAAAQLQFPLQRAAAALPVPQVHGQGQLTVESLADGVRVRGTDCELTLSASGEIVCWQVGGRQLLAGGGQPTVWHAPTENEGVRAVHYDGDGDESFLSSGKLIGSWYRGGLHDCRFSTTSMRWQAADDGVHIELRGRLLNAHNKRVLDERRHLIITGDGSIHAEHRFQVAAAFADLPRLGVVYAAARGLDTMEWLGHGPGESYRDRCLGTPVGRYRCAVRDRYVPYIMPQEHGNIAGLRWLSLSDQDGSGFIARAQGRIEGKATQVSDACLTAARHTTDVQFLEHSLLHLDCAQRGLGTGSCGPDTLPRYRLHSGEYQLRYLLSPL